jgi:hypothetical protein
LCERGFDKRYQVALKNILELQELVEQQDKNLSCLQTRAQHLGERKIAALQEPQATQVSLCNGSRAEDSSKSGKAEQSLVNQAAAESVRYLSCAPIMPFIPERQLVQLRTERYKRVQAEEESMGNYIQDIREIALVLRISEP